MTFSRGQETLGYVGRLALIHYADTVQDMGIGRGKGYAVNVPLRDGITDESYQSIFKPVSPRSKSKIPVLSIQVIQHIMDFYRPGAVVLQCGADSLSGDKLGCFNLSLEGMLKREGVPS